MLVTTDRTINSHDEVVIHLVGRLDADAASEVQQHFKNALAWGFGPITLDGADLTNIDAHGVDALVRLSAGALAEHRGLRLRNFNRQVSRFIGPRALAMLLVEEDPQHVADTQSEEAFPKVRPGSG